MFSFAEIMSIISAAGVIGTLIIGFFNLFYSKVNLRLSQEYNLRLLDFEKRRDTLSTTISEYIALLDAHSLSYMALSEKEYEGKDLEIGAHYYKLETAFYKIKLNLNTDNPSYTAFLTVLEESLNTAETIKTNTTLSELIASGLRNEDAFATFYVQYLHKNEKEKLNSDCDLGELRVPYLGKVVSAVNKLQQDKKNIVSHAQEYLKNEKLLVTGKKR